MSLKELNQATNEGGGSMREDKPMKGTAQRKDAGGAGWLVEGKFQNINAANEGDGSMSEGIGG